MEREFANAKTAPLTWGQEVIWFEYESVPVEHRARFNIPIEVPLEPGISPRDVRNAIAALIRRHETLRTVFTQAGDNPPLQLIEPYPGRPICVQDYGGPGSRTSRTPTSEALLHEPFDIYARPPWRVGVIREEDGSATLILVVHHILADAGGAALLRAGLWKELTAGPSVMDESAGAIAQPYDLTLFETSEKGRLINERSLAHHRNVLWHAPPRMFRSADGKRSVHQLEMKSPRTFAAADRVASQCETSLATVYLAVFASFVAGVSGLSTCAFTMDVANRYDSLTRQIVGNVFEPAPILIDLTDDPPFLEAVRRAEDASIGTQRSGRFSFLELKRLERDIAWRRGVRFRWGINFNFIPAPPEPTEAEPSSQTEVCRWLPDSAQTDIDFWWALDPATSRLEVLADSELLSRDVIGRMAAGIRPILLAASANEGPRTSEIAHMVGLCPQLSDQDWHISEGGWISLSELARELSAHPSVDGCELHTRHETPDGLIRIAVTVRVKDESLDAGSLRAYLMERLGQMRSCAIPGRLEIRCG